MLGVGTKAISPWPGHVAALGHDPPAAAEAGQDLENWKTGKLRNWKTGKLENWKTWKPGNWKTGKLEN
jgi:hypothetical protein